LSSREITYQVGCDPIFSNLPEKIGILGLKYSLLIITTGNIGLYAGINNIENIKQSPVGK
jgi:hypothetical protein